MGLAEEGRTAPQRRSRGADRQEDHEEKREPEARVARRVEPRPEEGDRGDVERREGDREEGAMRTLSAEGGAEAFVLGAQGLELVAIGTAHRWQAKALFAEVQRP